MTFSNTTYFIEVNENGQAKIVPHTGKNYQFIEGKKATAFLKELKARHPDKNFRRVQLRKMYKHEEWL